MILVSSWRKHSALRSQLWRQAERRKGFERLSQTRTHCSPPSAAVIAAASNALTINNRRGDAIRRRLAQRVKQFCLSLKGMNLIRPGGLFPVSPYE